MSVREDYARDLARGGSLSRPQCEVQLDARSRLGQLINDDPTDRASDIGRRIFNHLDLRTAIAFSRVSKGVYERARTRWFATQAREVVLRYIQQRTSYTAYVKSAGWAESAIVGLEMAGVALTVASAVTAQVHRHHIPAGAPKKEVTHTDPDSGKTYKVTVIDHPEARKAAKWEGTAIGVGILTTTSVVCHGIAYLLRDVSLGIFFSAAEKELLGNAAPNPVLDFLAPDFHKWRLSRMHQKLVSNPPDWQKDPELNQMICPISKDFMLFPVVAKCKHCFDYRSIRGYQLNPTSNPLECPICPIKPNTKLVILKFDMVRFGKIQRAIHPASRAPIPISASQSMEAASHSRG